MVTAETGGKGESSAPAQVSSTGQSQAGQHKAGASNQSRTQFNRSNSLGANHRGGGETLSEAGHNNVENLISNMTYNLQLHSPHQSYRLLQTIFLCRHLLWHCFCMTMV